LILEIETEETIQLSKQNSLISFLHQLDSFFRICCNLYTLIILWFISF